MKNKIKFEDFQNLKELTCFWGVINSLKTPQKRDEKLDCEDKIPVILSADDNYAKFIAVTGASVLYNTHSFIEFYILSEEISQAHKTMIEETFSNITSHYSIKFIECNSKEYFSKIKLSPFYHVRLSTCNRLLFPLLAPEVKRAIYLDVDLIAIGDVKELWDIDLEGNIFAVSPSYITLKANDANKIIKAPNDYQYFNSGVMLIDYEKWREKIGTNRQIIDNLLDIINDLKITHTPDEVVLNRFAFLTGGYRKLEMRFNTCVYDCYSWFKNNKLKLNKKEAKMFKSVETNIKANNFEKKINIDKGIIFRHYAGTEKPWNTTALKSYYEFPYISNFSDFWFYASLTSFYEEIKDNFVNAKMHPYYEWQDDFYDSTKEKIFSIKKLKVGNKHYSVLTIFGIRMRFKTNSEGGVKLIRFIFNYAQNICSTCRMIFVLADLKGVII